MNYLPVTPYKKTENLTDATVTLKLTKADFDNVTYKTGTTVLSFFGCRFNKLIIEVPEEIVFEDVSIAFFNCIIDRLEMEEIESGNVTLGFYGCVVNGRIKTEQLLSATFNNCLVPSGIFVMDTQSVNVSFSKENVFLYRWKSLFKRLGIRNYKDLSAAKHSYHLSNVKRIRCSSNYPETPKKDRFKTSLNISYEKESTDTDTEVSNLNLVALSISGSPVGSISIENTKVSSWYIYDFYPKGQTSFYNISPVPGLEKDAKIGIHKSILDNVEFNNIDFDRYPLISLYRTKFSKAIYLSCDFPRDYKTFEKFVEIENVHYPDKKPKNYDKAQYEIFLQLKKAMDDIGNYYESQKLQAMAHDALKKIKGISYADRKILEINSSSNDHGLSIIRPLIGFFLFSIPLYILYLDSIDRIFTCREFDPNLIGYYFSFVDITHRSDFLYKEEPIPGWTLAIDYIGKLVVSFFIYQFIAAFRKYGKN